MLNVLAAISIYSEASVANHVFKIRAFVNDYCDRG